MEESSSEQGGPKSNKKVEPKKQNSTAAVDVKQKSLKGKLRSKVSSRFINESQHSDLIFNLDFYWFFVRLAYKKVFPKMEYFSPTHMPTKTGKTVPEKIKLLLFVI